MLPQQPSLQLLFSLVFIYLNHSPQPPCSVALLTLPPPLPPPGGEDFDQRVMEHFIKLFKKKTGKDVRKDNRAVQKLRREVEKAKRALSSQHQARVEVESFFDGEDFSETLTRARFEELNMVSSV